MIKKIAVVLVLTSLGLGIPNATAATKVKISPQYKVSHTRPLLVIRVANLPKDHGIYIQQCMAPKANQAPTSCNPAERSNMWVSNLKADIAQGAHTGAGKITFRVDAYFKGGDCIHTTCVISIKSDHNATSDRSEDQVIPFKFS